MDKLQLAVNHALAVNSAAIERARQLAANPMGLGMDAKRSQAWCEYGWKEKIEFQDLYNAYKRGGLAFGAVTKLIGKCWGTMPWIIEGEEQQDATKLTAWEQGLQALLPEDIWAKFEEADKRRLVGRYSALILRVRDGKKLKEPVRGRYGLADVIPVWANSLTVSEWHMDSSQENYGTPKMWQYTAELENGTKTLEDVHPDRVFILGDFSRDAIGFLEPAYNAFTNIEKVEGGSGESFLKNAARQVVTSFDKEIDLNGIATMYGVTIEQLQEKFNEAARALNQGIDSMLITQGATTTAIQSTIADPSPTYNVNLQTVSAALDIPSKILVGMQTGERASTEDQKYWDARCQSRRERELTPDIRRFLKKLDGLKIIQLKPVYTVMWDDLTESTVEQKLDNASKLADINQKSVSGTVFTDNEIRNAAGYEATDMPDPMPEGETTDDGDQQA